MSGKKKTSEPAASPIPEDVLWPPEREIRMFAMVPCRLGGFRIVERRCSLEEAAVFGSVGERNVGSILINNVARAIGNDATKR